MTKAELKPIKWKWDYGVYVPFCPYCGEPAYEKDKCFSCGKSYKWVEGEYKPTEVQVGEYLVVQATNNHVHIYKDGNMVFHSQCDKKFTEDELREHVDFYKQITSDENFKKILEDEEDG